MSNDIVDRLRIVADDPMWSDHAEVSKDLFFAAAREIERLQTELVRSREAERDLSAQIDRMCQEGDK